MYVAHALVCFGFLCMRFGLLALVLVASGIECRQVVFFLSYFLWGLFSLAA